MQYWKKPQGYRKYSHKCDCTVTQQENKALWSCLCRGHYSRTDMAVHFGIRGNLAWSDVINWPNPFLFLYVGTTVSILFPNSVCLSHFLKTSHHGFYTTSIVLCCPDLSLQTSSWGLTQISFAAIPHCFQFWTTHSQKDQDCIWFVSALAFQFISTHSALIHTTKQTQTHGRSENTKSNAANRSAPNDLQPVLTSGLRDHPRTAPKP